MNDKEYLKQISSAVRPEKKSKMSFLSSPIAKTLSIGVVGLIVIIIIGSMLGGGKASTVSKTASLKFHLDNTAVAISDYKKFIKSSDLRSSSASLYSVLTNTSKEVAEILPKLGFSSDSADSKKLSAKATKDKEALENDLFEAKINGTLDRIFALKMAYEISIIMSDEAEIHNATSNEDLKSSMSSSYNSLSVLYDKFNDFSETK